MKTELNNKQKAILKTLLYSDIFDFPLTIDEITKNLISKTPISKTEISETLKTMEDRVIGRKGFYCIRGRARIIDERLSRMKNVARKMKIAVWVSKILSFIPTISFIGVSGRLSHLDAYADDDIDLIIITRKNSLWVTRLILLMALEALNVRRKKTEKTAKNKICPNLLLDETALSWQRAKRDVYTAHEILNILPLYNKNNTYEQLLKANKWVKDFYANYFLGKPTVFPVTRPRKYLTIKIMSILLTAPFIELISRKFSSIYMRSAITNEVISKNFAAFHPQDVRPNVLALYNEKLAGIA